ncbi:MAG: HPr family phosphocarrier protein [Tyzzerella sp.]|uniref:HPr family phosphocarrier protein n=1 Tax=Candidatus Fimicola merdigallinarum TaxID=2840819 RepID=A0A9D9H3W7_9FIRM|nr:HPr family phosphocarrier protein [Candidatus Fimicola merdigallinarum]
MVEVRIDLKDRHLKLSAIESADVCITAKKFSSFSFIKCGKRLANLKDIAEIMCFNADENHTMSLYAVGIDEVKAILELENKIKLYI